MRPLGILKLTDPWCSSVWGPRPISDVRKSVCYTVQVDALSDEILSTVLPEDPMPTPAEA